ncbi:hypothetical protein [Leclercia sp. Marseille-Q4284]|uniref:hypothetical protein n=1 Tax=Leclercia sp. Marseille-Q4284 TaxID=2866582 RepID=UPI001CE49FD3|nr:hypothetical protein [Leclercia sp. Marseille-Q4284]
MNIQTIKYISMIAGTAAARVTAGKTLKASKAWLVEAMSEENTPFVNVDGVDFEEVNKRIHLINAVNINTKGGFVRQLETAVARMAEQHDNVIFATRVQHAIKSAADRHGVVIHAADVIEWANGDIYFNFTKAADALAAVVEPFEVTVKGSVGVNNPFHAGDVVYVGAIEGMKATVTAMPKVGDVITATDWRGNTERVKVRQVMNECPPRPAHLQACVDAHHDELFSGFFNDRQKPTPERKRQLEDMNDDQIYIEFGPKPAPVAEAVAAKPKRERRKPAVTVAGTAKGKTTWRVQMEGRTYLYTDGAKLAQQRLPRPIGGHRYKDVISSYMLARIKEIIREYQKRA